LETQRKASGMADAGGDRGLRATDGGVHVARPIAAHANAQRGGRKQPLAALRAQRYPWRRRRWPRRRVLSDLLCVVPSDRPAPAGAREDTRWPTRFMLVRR
jgi:hypothetical protein